MPKFRR
ncbi:unnamed protein product [Linum tenue]|nr:unnamed protein product [Linum tenue]